MKLSFSTLGCPVWDLSRVVCEAKKNGLDGIELRGLQGELDFRKISALSPEKIAETRALLDGLEIPSFSSSLVMDRSADREETLRDGKDLIDLCSRDGIGLIRVFGNEIFPDEDEKKALAHISAGLAALAGYAEGKNVSILLEVHGNLTNLARLRAISEAVPSPAFGILWDVAHTDKEYRDRFTDFYRPLLPRIKHVHLKDHFRLEKGTKLTDFGTGEIPLRAITESLLADGYTGYFSFEWEKMWHPELRDLDEELPLFAEYMRKIG